MAEFEVERGMPADAETVFAVATDVGRMSRWLPGNVEPEGTWSAEPGQLRLEWGRGEYAGWLQVSHADPGSAVVLHLSFGPGLPEARADRAEAERLTGELRHSLDRLAVEVDAAAGQIGRQTRAPER